MTKVVAAVVLRDRKYLIARRPRHKQHGGLWEFPGGKIRSGETTSAALRRELREELGVDAVIVGETIAVLADGLVEIQFLAVDMEDEPAALEHTELRWCSLTDLARIDFAPIDKRLVIDITNREQ